MLPSLFPVLYPRHRGRAPEPDYAKQKFLIIVDPTNAIFNGDTGNVSAHMPKPGVDHQRNTTAYYGKSLLYH
jgi:hypothetical protein